MKPESVPSVFQWSEEKTPRRELFKYPLPVKRKTENSMPSCNDFERMTVNMETDSTVSTCVQVEPQADWMLG